MRAKVSSVHTIPLKECQKAQNIKQNEEKSFNKRLFNHWDYMATQTTYPTFEVGVKCTRTIHLVTMQK